MAKQLTLLVHFLSEPCAVLQHSHQTSDFKTDPLTFWASIICMQISCCLWLFITEWAAGSGTSQTDSL